MQAGRRERLRLAAMRQFGASGPRFPSFFDVDCETLRAATHVDAYDGVLSDAGSTPAASTSLQSLILLVNLNQALFVYLIRTNLAVGTVKLAVDGA